MCQHLNKSKIRRLTDLQTLSFFFYFHSFWSFVESCIVLYAPIGKIGKEGKLEKGKNREDWKNEENWKNKKFWTQRKKGEIKEQAGAEQCQAQQSLCLLPLAPS